MSARIHDVLDAQADARGDAPALSDRGGVRWSYAGLRAASRDAADAFTGDGVGAGDRVLVVAENCAEAVAHLFGASRVGAWAVPVNARLVAREIDRIAAHARPRAVVLATAASPDAAAHAERMGAEPRGRVATALPHPSDPATDADVAVLLYTTGTTGEPKAVMLTHGNLLFAGRASSRVRGIGPGDTVCGALPTTHVFGLASMLMACVTGGGAIRLEPRFEPARALAILDGDGAHGPATIFPGVPQMHTAIMRHARGLGRDALGGGLRYASSGGAPLDPSWKREVEAFYGVALQNGYGLTESTAGMATTSNALGDPDVSTGPPLPGVEIRIDEAVPGGGGGEGEIVTRGPHVMRGYWGAPEATAAALRDGWLRTGDLGRIDAEGRLHVVGRAKELIIHGGFNVHPPEVEAALNEHPAVAQCAVVGRPREGGDEEVVAFVELAGPASEAELATWARERLAGYKRPARIVTADALPCAPTGKVLKHELLRVFADRL